MAADEQRALQGRWVHSHEEDTDREMIFRVAGHPFPPARGRTSLDLRPDGTYVQRAPGPVDVPEESTGRWSLEGERLVLDGGGDRPGQSWEITAPRKGVLRLRKG